MALSYARLRGTMLSVVVLDNTVPKDELRKRLGDGLGLKGLVEQSEAIFSDKNGIDFVRAFDAALEELTSAGVVDLVKDQRRTFVTVNDSGKKLYTEDPYVADTSLEQCRAMFGAVTPPETVLASVIAKHKADDETATKRDAVLDDIVSAGRLTFQTETLPDMLELLSYVEAPGERFFLSPAHEVAGEAPYAIAFTDRFGFVTLVRGVTYASKFVGQDDMTEFTKAMSSAGATRGMFFTTASFDNGVLEHYKDPRVKRNVAVFTGADTFEVLVAAGLV